MAEDATFDLLAALKLAGDPEAHRKLTEAAAEHKKAKDEADASIADLRNRAYQLDKRRDELDAAEKAHASTVNSYEAAKTNHDLAVTALNQQRADYARDKAELDVRARDIASRENAIRSRDEWLTNAKEDLERAKAAFEAKVAQVKAILGG